jgi:hypothetical protein
LGGDAFGHYRLVKLIGRGGMSEVWRAFDSATNRMVGMRVLPAHLATNPTFEQRFRREAFAAAGLNNPHVIPIHNFGEIDGQLYVVRTGPHKTQPRRRSTTQPSIDHDRHCQDAHRRPDAGLCCAPPTRRPDNQRNHAVASLQS